MQNSLTVRKAGLAAGVFCAAMTIATPFVMPLEGRTLAAYLDVNGVPTICNGITKGVTIGQTRTDSECDNLLHTELGEDLKFVQRKVKVDMSPWQLAALGSFTYNVGQGNFLRSSVLRKMNAGDTAGACEGLMDWVYIGKKDCRIAANKCAGIVRRRKAEKELCLKTS